jgi:NADPH-dependent 2,4-dienoyl-CoA reductase/sulfur reductase-like enzyme
VLLADGTELPCQLVLAGIGVIPDTGLASAAGLTVDNGIIVSRAYRTDDDAIWAIGDVARAPSRYELRIESIHHAQASSQIAAADMMGGELPADEALWFWSDQYDVKFQMAGMLPSAPEGALQHVSRAGRRDHSLSVWSWCDGVLVTVEAANDGQAYMIGKKCLEAGISPDPADIANPDFGLKTLIA